MPKGKKKGKKGKSGKKGKKGKSAGKNSQKSGENDEEDDIFMDKEVLLKEKLMEVCKDIDEAKDEIKELKESNAALEEECERVRLESEGFANFIKERERRQDDINIQITLQDYYTNSIKKYEEQGRDIMLHYNDLKEEKREKMAELDQKIEKLHKQIRHFDPYQKRRDEQKQEIAELEEQIRELRSKQSIEIDLLRSNLDQEFTEFLQKSHKKIHDTKQEAYKNALQTLKETFDRVENENEILRSKILNIIESSKILNIKKFQLTQENKKLKEDLKYATDFSRYRQIRQEKPMELAIAKHVT